MSDDDASEGGIVNNLYRVHARCELLAHPDRSPHEIHQVSAPMSWAEANGKLMEWCMAVESDAWQFTIEPEEEVFPLLGSSLDSDKKPW